jgi:hypothetical protein
MRLIVVVIALLLRYIEVFVVEYAVASHRQAAGEAARLQTLQR